MKESKLKQWRKANGLTVKDASVFLGCSIGHYSEMERGLKIPSLIKAMAIERKTGGFVTPYDFAPNYDLNHAA